MRVKRKKEDDRRTEKLINVVDTAVMYCAESAVKSRDADPQSKPEVQLVGVECFGWSLSWSV